MFIPTFLQLLKKRNDFVTKVAQLLVATRFDNVVAFIGTVGDAQTRWSILQQGTYKAQGTH
ncbi:hypothetical protein BN8_03914 [Fibrisoma limi BUZ 3]|uniref:Uncharacterized protein n=1 Tax=Fibrisoma limi BUZ 3 TaxID=1185876 RepID=I2GLD9_9BACT|nr:hypothetical protein BN8_03914 [Fibrisoma limi BUZ 3]